MSKMNSSKENYSNDKNIDISIIEEEVETSEQQNDACFVALHIGAGFHSVSKTGAYRNLCETICHEVDTLLRNGMEARKAVTYAIELLENSPLTNAGLGSNLTLDEKTECDAAIMDKHGFASVGAVSNIKNPIKIPLSLLEAQSKGTLSLGRIVPIMLVGDGAKKWAREHNIEEVDDDALKTESVLKSHRHYKQKLITFEKKQEVANTKFSSNISEKEYSENSFFAPKEFKSNDETISLDTVGCIVLDKFGNLATAISSGGILLKYPGRVGHSSMFGCGCYFHEERHGNSEKSSIAVCTTGCGEYIIKTLFAKEISEHVLKNKDETQYNLTDFFKNRFFDAPLLKIYDDKLIGTMIVLLNSVENSTDKSIELLVAHTTPSMCFGYFGFNMNKPLSVMSRLEDKHQNTKEATLISNFRFKFNAGNSEPINYNDSRNNINETKKSVKEEIELSPDRSKKPKPAL